VIKDAKGKKQKVKLDLTTFGKVMKGLDQFRIKKSENKKRNAAPETTHGGRITSFPFF